MSQAMTGFLQEQREVQATYPPWKGASPGSTVQFDYPEESHAPNGGEECWNPRTVRGVLEAN